MREAGIVSDVLEHQHVRGLRGREGRLGGGASMLLWLRRAKTLESLGVEEG